MAANGRTEPIRQATVQGNANIAGGQITHVIMIVQENRSFDSYFGTYPGADGIPMSNGQPTQCVPDPADATCVYPYLSNSDISYNSEHYEYAAVTDMNGGKMDGFISLARQQNLVPAQGDTDPNTGQSAAKQVMAYHTGATSTDQLYSYWQMAKQYVLEDHLFEAVPTWSSPSHNYLVSGWSASYAPGVKGTSCVTSLCKTNLDDPLSQMAADHTDEGWHSLAALLTQKLGSKSWAFFSNSATPAIWKPLLNAKGGFADVQHDMAANGKPSAGQDNPSDINSDLAACNKNFTATQDCTSFPNVSWIVPSSADSEHPPFSIYAGESYVTKLVNQIGNTPSLWNHTAIFLSWDDWGGFYDHLAPPVQAPNGVFGKGDIGYGLRVPGLIISPFSCPGLIDSNIADHDSYLRFIEDDLLSQTRISASDRRPDQRDAIAGGLTSDFCGTAPRPFTNIPLPVAPQVPATVNAADAATMLANLDD
jgi:phospholipase C